MRSLEPWSEICPDPVASMVAYRAWEREVDEPELRWVLPLLGSPHALGSALQEQLVELPTGSLNTPAEETLFDLAQEAISHEDEFGRQMETLRVFHHTWALALARADLLGEIEVTDMLSVSSRLSRATLRAAAGAAWEHVATESLYHERCPVSLVVLGPAAQDRLGYGEVIEIAALLDDEADAAASKMALRFGAALRSGLSEEMARGHLYRLNHAPRPSALPASGPLRLAEAIAALGEQSETWEQARWLPSAMVFGEAKHQLRWRELRESFVGRRRTERALEHALRRREEIVRLGDHERSSFLGPVLVDLEIVDRLLHLTGAEETIRSGQAAALVSARAELTRLVERVRLLGAPLPRSEQAPSGDALGAVTRGLGWSGPEALVGLRQRHEVAVRIVSDELGLRPPLAPSRQAWRRAAARIGPPSDGVLGWIEHLPESDQWARCLAENPSTADRVGRIARVAPAMLGLLNGDPVALEEVWTGRIGRERPECGPARSYLRSLMRFVLEGRGDPGAVRSACIDQVLSRAAAQIGGLGAIVAVGSYGAGEMSLHSDADILLVGECPPPDVWLTRAVTEAGLDGFKFEVDLLPGPSRISWTWDELAYAQPAVALKLVRGRIVWGAGELPRRTRALTPDELDDLIALRRLEETERVPPRYISRQLKLGWGGLEEIEWLMGVHQLLDPSARPEESPWRFDARLRGLQRALRVHALEADTLRRAHDHLVELRLWLALLGQQDDVVPENPFKLDRLAEAMHVVDGNAVLSRHEELRQKVHALFEEGLQRLRGQG